MNTKYLIFCVLLLPTCWLVCESQFTKKKSKLPSTAQLKTDCGYSCGDYLDYAAQLRQNLAALDRAILDKSRELVEGTTDSLFAKSSKEDLQLFDSKVQKIKNNIVALNAEVEKQLAYIKELE